LIAVDYVEHALKELDLVKGVSISEEAFHGHNINSYYYDHAIEIINNILQRQVSLEYFLEDDDIQHFRDLTEPKIVKNGNDEHGHGHGDHSYDKEKYYYDPQTHQLINKETGKPKNEEEQKESDALSPDDQKFIDAFTAYKEALTSVSQYYFDVERSPTIEMNTIVNALNGGYVTPASGGDPVANPKSIPAGRNTYGIDAERAPTKEAWNVGVKLARQIIDVRLNDTGDYPKKVAFTLWSSEFVRQQGITIAEILYLLGVEPVRNSRGTVHDVHLISMEELKRPRIDVIVQTSGQFRDLGASRLYLINKAVKLAAEADDDGEYPNYVKEGNILAEKIMKEKGASPERARELAHIRVFGGVNGNYGTAIMEMVEDGDSWEEEDEVARQYLMNMGAMYDKDNWSQFQPGMFEAAIQNTDTIVHPRSSNTWGPLSLDHVYEFMGGLNNAIRYATGNEPNAYFSDLRNKNRPKIQGAKEAIWTEARTTLLNPKYIAALQEGGASSAEVFAETMRDTYGWDVMKPEVIDEELWDGLYDVYVKDVHGLNIEEFFRRENPYALQEMTAVMLEVVRKGYWKPGKEVIKDIAELHASLVKDYKAGCSQFVCDNAKLREMISQQLDEALKQDYLEQINQARVGQAQESQEGMELKKEKLDFEKVKETFQENMGAVVTMLVIVALFSLAVLFGAKGRKA
ncbi:MAG: cobaltochelatase subunit CobN, partial [Candidatus Omnitrophica bacterium]|nr:cobaltochelatase subunit CobN [Candidatus Omnitrophota bacterium]